MRRILAAAVLGIAVLTLPLVAAAEGPRRPEPGFGVFLVVLEQAYASGGMSEPLDVAKYGGVEHERRGAVRVVTLPLSKWAAVEAHPDVAYVQRVWMGESLENWAEGRHPRNRLRAAQYATAGAASASASASWDSGEYSYDGSGNVVKIGENQYAYDSAGRIVTASVSGIAEQYGYDSFGNLVAKRTGERQTPIPPVDPNSNRFVGYSYDAAGSVTSLPGSGGAWETASRYEYDGVGMPVLVSGHTGLSAQRMIYTADDERIAAMQPGGDSKIWIRGFDKKVLREYRGPLTGNFWTWVQDYVWAEGRVLAAEREATNGGRLHFHQDHLGSTRLITRGDRTKLTEHEFLPFGVERTDSAYEVRNFDVTPNRIEPMKFTGHERDFYGYLNVDGLDHLDYMHARFYDPALGRFLSVDAVMGKPDEPQSWNRYAYARNNPVRLVDPDGNVEVEFTIRHFIPASTVQLLHGRNLGDGRNFSLRANASVRTERTIRVETDPALNPDGIVRINPPRIGRSENLTFGLSGFASGESMTADVRRIPGMGMLITTTQNEVEPTPMSLMAPQSAMFLTGRGGIRSTVNIFVGEDASEIHVWGSRSSFPAMEINATVGDRTFAIFRGNESEIWGGFGIFGTEAIDRECTASNGSYTCN